MRTLVAFIIGTRKRGRDEHAKDLEILVLRHQLRVLRRTAGPPKLRVADRVLLAAVSRVLPRERWVDFLVAFIIGTRKRGRDEHAKDLEILVLRHQLRVLRRTAGPPKLRVADRVLLAAVSRVLPRDRWGDFLFAPPTLPRRH